MVKYVDEPSFHNEVYVLNYGRNCSNILYYVKPKHGLQPLGIRKFHLFIKRLAKKDLEAKEPVYERIIQNGHSLLDETEPGPERDAVQQRLDDLTNSWNGVKDKADKRSSDIDRVYPLAQAHNDNYVTFSVYLNNAEKKLNDLKPPAIDEEELIRQQKELEDFRNEVLSKKPLHTDYNNTNDPIYITCKELDITRGLPELKDEVDGTNARWDKLNGDVDQRQKDLDDATNKLNEMEEKLKPINDLVDEVQKLVKEPVTVGADVEKGKEAKAHTQKLKSDLEERKPSLEDLIKEIPAIKEKVGEGAQPIEEKCTALQTQMDECSGSLDDLFKSLEDQVDHAEEFNDACDELKKWLPEAQASPAITEPISSDPEEILKQIQDVKALEEDIVARRPTLEKAQASAAWLLDVNKGNPEKCAEIEEQLKAVALPFQDLVNQLDDKQKKLGAINKALDQYMKEKVPLEELIKATEEKVDNMEPAALDVEKDEADLKELDDLLSNLEKRKPDLRAVNRAGQALIRQLDSPDDIEKDLDRLSDKYYEVVDKTKDKQGEQKAFVTKIKLFIEVIEILEIWIQETYVIIEKVDTSGTEPENVKKQLEVVQDTRIDLRKRTPQLKEAEDLGKWCVDNLDSSLKPAVEERLKKVKEPMEEDIPKKLDELESKLGSNLASSKQFLENLDDLNKWLSKMDNAVDQQKPISADKDTSQRQLNEQNYILEDLNSKEPQFEAVLKEGEDLLANTAPGEECKALEEKVNALKNDWNKLKDRMNDRKARIDEVNALANDYDDKKNKDLPSLENIEEKAKDLDVISAIPEELVKQDETCKELLDEFTKQKPEYENMINVGSSLVEKADADVEPIKEEVDKLKERLVEDEEKLKRARGKVDNMKLSLDLLEEKKQPVEEICKQAEELLTNTPPFGDDIEKADQEIASLQEMLDKMNAEKPMLDSLNKAGDDVIVVDDSPDNVTTIKQMTDELGKTYDDDMEKLKEKIEKTKKDKETAQNFKDKLNASQDKIKPIKEKVDSLEPVGATPEKVKEQLVECEEMQAICLEADNLFNEANALGDELMESNENKPEECEPIKDKLATAKEPIKECTDKLNDREQKLKNQLQECGAFQDQIDDFLRRIKNLDNRMEQHNEEPLSMKEGPAAVSLQELQAIKKDLNDEAPVFANVLESGRKLLDSIESPEEKEAMKAKLDDTEKAWNELQNKLEDQLNKEEDVANKTKSLDDKIADLEKKLDDHEKKLRLCEPVSCSPEELEQQQKEINTLQNDTKLCKEALDELEKLKSELDPVCKKDVDEVEERIKKLKDHLEEVDSLGQTRQAEISDVQDKVSKFNDLTRPVKDKLGKLEKNLADQNLIGADKSKIMKVLEEITKIEKQAEDLQPKVEEMEEICNDLTEKHPTTDSKHLRDDCDEIKDRLAKLKAKIDTKKDEVAGIANDWDQMEADVAKALETVKKANTGVEESKPKTLDVDELPIQIENIKAIEADLDESAPVFDDLQKRGKKLREKGIGSDTIGDQLALIDGKLKDIKKEIPERVDDLEKLKDSLDDFNEKLKDADKDMTDVEQKVAEQPPVGGDKETIDKQMEGLKELGEELEKLVGKVKDLNDIRSDIKTKYPNADSSKVDEPLDSLNDRLNNISQNVSDRQSKLEDALVQCGQFDDAIQSMLKWLEDTAEIVDGQKPIAAADQNVLKAQIQGQKLLKRMFNDREPSIANLNKTGEELLATTEDEDKKKEIRAALDKVNEMFGSMKEKVDDRSQKLDDTLAASEKFNKDFDDVQEKINELKKKVDSDDNVPLADPQKLNEQIENIKPVHEECLALQPLLEDVRKDLEPLEELCTPEDGELLNKKVDDLEKQSNDLNHGCKDKEHTLEDARDLLKDLLEKDKEFDDWIKSCADSIESLKANPDADSIKKLQKDITDKQDDLEKLKDISKDLKKLVKPTEYPTVKAIVEADEEKYKKLKTDMDETARDAFMNKEKVEAFDNTLSDLKKWTDAKLDHYRIIEPVAVEADKIKEQIGVHNLLTAEVNGKEPEFKTFYSMGATILAACDEDEAVDIKDKIDSLKHNKQKVNKLTTERQENLVEGLILAQQFADVYKDITTRLTNTESLLSQVDEEKGRGVEMQKEKLQNIEDNIRQLQPLITAIQKTGADLIKLSGPGQGSDSIQKKIDECLERWNQLKLSSEEKGITIGAAAVQVENVWNDLEELIEKTQLIKEEIKKQEPVPVHEEPILEEVKKLEEQEAVIKDLEEPCKEVNERVESILESDPSSPASKALKDRQRKLNNNWNFIQTASKERRNSLDETKDAAIKFWPGLEKIKDTLLEVQTKMDEQGEPGLDPKSIESMLSELDDIHKDLDSNKNIVTELAEVTPVLVSHASNDNKIEVQKLLSEITDQWDTVETAWGKRKDELEHVKALLLEFQKEKASVDEWLTEQEEIVKTFSEVPADMNELRSQLRKLRGFHRDLIKNQNKITKADQQGSLIAEKLNDEDSQLLCDQLEEMKQRWDKLLDTSYDHQHNLEDSLLQSGQFGIAIEELLVWIEQTKAQLTAEEEIPKEKKLIEILLAKLKVIRSDVESHRPGVENVQTSAQKLLDENKASDRDDLTTKLNELNIGWEEIQKLLQARQDELTNAFEDSNRFQEEVRELIVWLSEARLFLRSKTPYGGKTDVVTKQLDKHKEFIRVIETREEKYIYIVETFEVLIKSSDISNSRILDKALTEIKSAWTEVNNLSRTKLGNLEEALENARLLEGYMSELEIWMLRVEGQLALFRPVSTILETIEVQIEEFEIIYVEVGEKREVFKKLSKTSSKVTEHCLPDDAKLIQVEIEELSVRWKVVAGKLKDRKRALDDNYDQSKIFFEGHEQLMAFLDQIENQINSDPTIGKDAQSVKAQLRKHRECQNELGKKQSKLNATIKTGTHLIPKSQPEEVTIIEVRISDLRARWDAVCAISVDRQHQLEEALLFHGMFQDAIMALLDWVKSVEPSLASETAVMGDTDTVMLLIDNHKTFQKDLSKREKNYNSIVTTGETMLKEGKVENADQLEQQLNNLKDRWEIVGQLSTTKHERLQNAYTLSKEFQMGSRSCLQLLADLESQLKEQGPIADDVPGIRKQQEEFAIFEEQLTATEVQVNGCLKKGEVILRFCHPSSLHTIRHQVNVLKKRWKDVSGWAYQRKSRLETEIKDIAEEEGLIEILLEWITEQETIIEERESLPLPDEYDLISKLLDEHKVTQEGAEQKQPDYGRVMKRAKRKPLTDRQRQRGRNASPPQREFANPRVEHLSKRWQSLWLNLMNRMRRLNDLLNEIRIRKAAADFSWPVWRDRYNGWLSQSKSRVLDMWRRYDNDKDNKLSFDEFISALMDSGFPCERWEVELVFDKIRRGQLITYQDFMDALKGRKRKPDKPMTESEQIHDIIGTEVRKCCCAKRFVMEKVGEGKYRFGEAQKLRLVRILRSVVMVRVGGGWESLQEFLTKNDPCRAAGRTNYELRENFIMPEHASQGMQAFKSSYGRNKSFSRDGSHSGSPSKSLSREGSSTGIPVRMSRERSRGEISRNGHHDHSTPCKAHPRTSLGVPAPTITRRKSDLDREGKNIRTYGKKDYSSVKGSGYGVSSSTPKKRTSLDPSTSMTRTPSQPKITRERSGDVYSRLYGTPKTSTTTPSKSATPKTTGGATPRRTTSTPKHTTTPAATRSPTKTTSEVKKRTSLAPSVKVTPAKTTAKTSTTPKTSTTKTTTTPKTSTTRTSASRTSSASSTDTPLKSPTTKTQTTGVFDRLTSTGTATKKAANKTPTSKKDTTKSGDVKPRSAKK